jgi:apolipoprotein N-acyltransferase
MDLTFPLSFKAFLLTFLEAFVPQQFPGHLGHSWIGLGEYLGVASVWGAAGFSFFSYLLILSFIEFYKTRKKFIFIWTTILLFIIANPLFSISQRKAQSKQGQSTRELAVRISQANIGNYLKLESEKGDLNSVDKVMEYFFKLAKAPYEAGDTKKPDIIIWSETSYPYAISSELLKKRRTVAPEIFKQIIFETGAEFLKQVDMIKSLNVVGLSESIILPFSLVIMVNLKMSFTR